MVEDLWSLRHHHPGRPDRHVLPRIGPLKGCCAPWDWVIVHIFIARWLFVNAGVWLNIVYPLLALSANYTVLSVYDYVTEERERKKIKDAFTHYVAPVVIEEMLKDPGRLKLGGEEKVLTVLFSDLQGFTSTSERYAPHEMIEILNEYYTRMTEQIFVYEGMLKEYVGDELMAIFGAPIEQLDHAERACAAALAMQEQRKALSEEWAKIGRPPLIARTGINSGLMLVGNLGSKYRFAYGALGDHVNLGSRLEGLNKTYKTQILIGENTAQMVENSFVLRELDTVQVVGREQAVRIYELLAKAGTSLPMEQEKAFSSLCGWTGSVPRTTLARSSRIFRRIPDALVGGRSFPNNGGPLPDLPKNTAAGRVGRCLRAHS